MRKKTIAFILILLIVLTFSKITLFFLSNSPCMPFIVLDSNDNVHLFWEEDANNDGDSDQLHYIKIDKKGKKIINNKKIVISDTALISPTASVDNDNNIHIFWNEVMNFRSGYHPFEDNIHYVGLDDKGNIKTNDTLLTTAPLIEISLFSFADELGNINLLVTNIMPKQESFIDKELINNHSIVLHEELEDSLSPYTDNKYSKYMKTTKTVDENGDIHQIVAKMGKCGNGFKCGGNVLHYKKIDSAGNTVIDKNVIEYSKRWHSIFGGYYPDIYGPTLNIDSSNNPHIVWYINDGFNHFEVYYVKLNNEGKIVNQLKIG